MMDNPKKISGKFKSTLGDIEIIVHRILEHTRSEIISELDYFGIELILREALNNSVIHGNKSDPGKMVYYTLVYTTDFIQFKFRDEGAGFDWKKALSRTPEISDEHNRGLAIMQMYGSEISYNQTGNEITLQFHYK